MRSGTSKTQFLISLFRVEIELVLVAGSPENLAETPDLAETFLAERVQV